MILQVLLLNGADVNSVDGGSRSALLSACWQVITITIIIIIIINIMITIITVTISCLLVGDHHHLTMYLQRGPSLIIVFTILILTCMINDHVVHQGHLHIADILLTAGADVNQQCCQGASPLAVSAQVHHDDDDQGHCYDNDQVQDHDHDDHKHYFDQTDRPLGLKPVKWHRG